MTEFGGPMSPGKSVFGEPIVCTQCGGVDTVHLTLNTETDELTVECWECGELYDPSQAFNVLADIMGVPTCETNL